MSDEFEVTYPCFFPLGEQGEYLTVTSNGDGCFPLLTDEDIAKRFYQSKYGDEATLTVELRKMRDKNELLEALNDMEDGLKSGEHSITHIGFDPSGQGIIPRTTIAEFVEYLESRD